MDLRIDEVSFDNINIQNYLQENAKKYLTIIKNEYGAFRDFSKIKVTLV